MYKLAVETAISESSDAYWWQQVWHGTRRYWT